MPAVKLVAANQLDANTEFVYSFCRTARNYTRLHSHDFFEISIVTAGTVRHHINGFVVDIPRNTIVFIRPSDEHAMIGTGEEDFEYINLAFSAGTLRRLADYLDCAGTVDRFCALPMPPMLEITSSKASELRGKIEDLALLPREDAELVKLSARTLIANLFALYFGSKPDGEQISHSWLKKLLEQMTQPENFIQGRARMQALSGKNHAYLSRVFREFLHTTPTDYINDLRLNYCANRLIHSDTPIIDIAMDAGFNNLSHFYHLFRKHYNTTPNRYRLENSVVV